MGKFVIISDTTCDLPESFQKEYDVNIVNGHIILPDHTSIQAFLSWDKYSREDFYSDLRKNPNGFTTAPPNVAEYAEAFEKYAAESVDILCVTISSGISGAYNFAVAAKKNILEKYPNARIEIVDTLRFGPAIGLMIVHAAIMRNEGKSLDEVVKYMEENKNRYHQAGWLDDLSFVAKKGRLTHAKAFFGSLAGVKPIGEFDYNGLTTIIGKVKGAKAAYAVLLKYIEETITNPTEQIIFIAQSDRLEQAKAYKKMLEEKFNPKAVYIQDVYPACGVNVGPGLMAAYYMGNPISSDLSVEKGIIEKSMYEGMEK